MTVRDYHELLENIASLSRQEKIALLADLAIQVRDEEPATKKRSITELKGVGKGLWDGMDAQEFVNRERDSWDD